MRVISQPVDETYRILLEFSPDAMVLTDQQGRMLFANSQTEQLSGYSQQELIGQPVELLVPERLRTIHARHREGYSATPKRRQMGAGLDLYLRRKDGTESEVYLAYFKVAGAVVGYKVSITGSNGSSKVKAFGAENSTASDDWTDGLSASVPASMILLSWRQL